MENIDAYTNHIRTFASMLHNKGYLGDFALTTSDKGRPLHEGLLHNCLKVYTNRLSGTNQEDHNLLLQTYAQYLSPSDYKQCSFHIHFFPEKGFIIDRMEIHSMHPDQHQRISVKNANDIPGKNAVLSRFRRPRPWDRMVRGGFVLKRRK